MLRKLEEDLDLNFMQARKTVRYFNGEHQSCNYEGMDYFGC